MSDDIYPLDIMKLSLVNLLIHVEIQRHVINTGIHIIMQTLLFYHLK